MLIKKFWNVGFTDIRVVERSPFGLDELVRYPLFAQDFLDFMRRAIPPERHRGLVFSIAVTATRSEAPPSA